MKRSIGIGIAAGGIAGIIAVISESINLISWVFFIGMLSYYASGCGVKGLITSTATNLEGVLFGWLIALVAGMLPQPAGLGISVFIFVIIMCMTSNLPYLGFVPGMFVGCSCYFGTAFDAPGVIYALVVGNVLAWISHVLGDKIGDLLEGKSQADEVN